jgi:hypothetical protein
VSKKAGKRRIVLNKHYDEAVKYRPPKENVEEPPVYLTKKTRTTDRRPPNTKDVRKVTYSSIKVCTSTPGGKKMKKRVQLGGGCS